MVLGWNENEPPYQMSKDEREDDWVDIPCVSITMESYGIIQNLLASESIIATISTTGEIVIPSGPELPEAQIQIADFLIILFPMVWGIVAMKWYRHTCYSKRRAKRIRERDIPEILYTEDLINCSRSKKRVDYLTNDCCPICLENFQKQMKVKRLPCGHGYHGDCIMPWMADHNQDFCPFCRQTISDKLDRVNGSTRSHCCRPEESFEEQDVIVMVQLSSLDSVSTSECESIFDYYS